jgi:hypothetical protein
VRLAIALLVAIIAIIGAGGTAPPAAAQLSAGALSITTTPSLSPAFDPNITDYVIPAGADLSVQVSVNAPRNTKVSVDKQPFRKLSFATTVTSLKAGQRMDLVVNSVSGAKTYHVRRLPSDFPTWTTTRAGTPQAEYYVFVTSASATSFYVNIADNNGVPIWWFHATARISDAKILPAGYIGWIGGTGTASVRNFAGQLLRNTKPVGSLDVHELLLLPNGDIIVIANFIRGPVDLSAFGGPSDGKVVDNVIEELAPNGKLVWQWSAMDHLSVQETDPSWWTQYLVQSNPADPYHMNAVEPDGDGFVVSLRHLNALIRIDQATGAIQWKLGGTHRAESLTFVGDPFGNFSGQHDGRIHPDGTLTLHDNGTHASRRPRAVHFQLDLNAGTATWLDQVTDALVAASGCCGSARLLEGGNWVTEWGQNPLVTELDPNGNAVLRLKFNASPFSYRAPPVPFGVLSRDTLRHGMDVQFPR